ncbi:thyroid adenoma-associated protein homolog [Mercenaria mercenaria]|uniref:thyroid adenoma-associated protein homolog n=1 Tax=Mercenaria mercenaria TaxID=6596 RepID=UPI00234F1D32|nr:thyroid adenoma-associated protein homolog [Mercenaria mercenaria]
MSKMCEADEKELLVYVFRKDPTILEDLQTHSLRKEVATFIFPNYRSGDAHRLVRRLDAVHKDNLIDSHKWTVPQEHVLLDSLVKCYMNTADSIKISRAVEKVWQPFLVNHGDYINNCLESQVMLVINTGGKDSLQIAKVSMLLEQNKLVQEIFQRNLEQVMTWLSTELSALLKLPPITLTPGQAQCVYALVKISLQLFQVCPEELGVHIWEVSEKISQFRHSVIVVVESLVYILQTQGYHTDCVLLCGTATALMLNCCRNVEKAVKSFLVILYQVLCADSTFRQELLEQTDLDTRQQKSVHDDLSLLTSSRLGPISLIRGVVACGRTDILFADCSVNKGTSQLLFEHLFEYICVLCRGDITLHYQAFQILLLWYTKLTKTPSSLEKIISTNNITSTLESTLEIVVLNWDSPVEDVPEAVVDIFSCMMSVWETMKDAVPDFPSSILKLLLSTQWYVKGRYRILAVLLKYVDAQKVLDGNPEIQAQLLQCLTTNHLASSATNVYRAFLQHLKSTFSTDIWNTSWLPTVIEGLVSDNSLLRYNTSLHWIPVTFKLLPMTSAAVQDHLSAIMEDPKSPISRVRLLCAWIVVSKSVRTIAGHTNLFNSMRRSSRQKSVPIHKVKADTSERAFLFSECISKIEVSLLMECLPYNIKIDSAPFRQHLGSDIRKLLVRLRDSCTTLLKSPTQNKDKLDCALDFVDWLHRLCIEFLLPGASYQRRKGSLDLLHVLYESLIYSANSKQRKGYVPESAEKLLDFAHSCKRWDFFCAENTQALILCLLDGAEEIQTSAFLLLTRYYTMSLDDNLKTPHRLCCHLLAESLRLCNSPKGHEGQCGAILCKLVFQKYVMESKIGFSICSNSSSNDYSVSATQNASVNSIVEFLEMLLSEVERYMSESEKDLVKASKKYPIHGLISAVTQCLTETSDLWMTPSPDLVHVSEQLVKLCQQIIEKMLNIMAGVAGQEACPSFAEIGMALENLLSENQTDYEETTSLSPEYQYMLSWCWNNIKGSCTSLGEVTKVTILSGFPISVATIHSISATFHTVLTKCRHKGVIEGCRSAYIKFCSALFHSNQRDILSVPEIALTEVLSSLKNRSISSSVTRRSAGLPIIIQAVLVSEKKMKKTCLLSKAVTSLFEICELPLDKDLGVTDLPQVHGLNILNSLFCDASLTASLIGHTSHAVILVIQQFGSPSWAIRNAATRFFSTLVTRIFGQKKSHGDKFCNSVTFQEFSSYYPDLPPFMLKILDEASEGDVMDISQIHAGLFPVLTLLSCLKPMDTEDQAVVRQLRRFHALMQPFLGSPVYQLRHLVASALVAMVTVQDMTSSVISCLHDHVTSLKTFNNICNNSLHGYLIYIHGLLDFIDRLEDQEKLWTLLTKETWLISQNNGMVSSVYVKILHRLLIDCPSVMCDEILEFVIVEHCTRGSKQIIGNSVYCEAAVEFLFESYNRNSLCLYGLVDKLLTFNNVEARKSCLEKLPKFLEKPGKNQQYNKMAVMAILCNCVKKENKQCLCTVLNLISSLYQDIGTIHKDDLHNLEDWFSSVNYEELKSRDSILVSVIPVQAVLIKHKIGSDGNRLSSTDLPVFCEIVNRFSCAVNESQRLSAVKALQIVGKHLLDLAVTESSQNWLTSLLESVMVLVQDEDTDIRLETCRCVSCINWEEKPTPFSSYHSNVCFELFLQYMCDNFWGNLQCVQFLYNQLTSPVSLQTLLVERESSKYQQLFDQEDNSFFAEKIYNAFDIHKYLKVMLKRCINEKKTDMLSKWTNSVSLNQIKDELENLTSVLQSIPGGSVVNLCSDNTVLSSICTFLLSCDIVAMVTNSQTIQAAIGAIVQIAVFHPVLQQKFETIHAEAFADS